MTIENKKPEIEELNPELFTFNNYEADYWGVFDVPFVYPIGDNGAGERKYHRAIAQYAIGFCDGSRLRVRPRSHCVGLMCEKDGEKFWFHLEKETLNKIFTVKKED